ncbi:hypothetical protein LCGC14_1362380 [marine sediment metagenome]|uniref:Uncharacterized protein n=1 Tax=marine sediment metagenome TaxID=412755 RepID=A0A0F9KTS1_9ZZZZ
MLTFDCAYEEIDAQDLPPRGSVLLTKELFEEYHISKILSDNPSVNPEHIASFRSKYYATIAAEALEKDLCTCIPEGTDMTEIKTCPKCRTLHALYECPTAGTQLEHQISDKEFQTLNKANQASCACLRVVYWPEDLENGLIKERWLCITCGIEFVRK